MTDKKKKPSNNGANGRDAKGRFTKGNPGGDGNPYAKQTAKLRAALYKAVTAEDIDAIVKKMVDKARFGDTHAANFVFDRVFGKPILEEGSGTETDPIHYVVNYPNADDNGK